MQYIYDWCHLAVYSYMDVHYLHIKVTLSSDPMEGHLNFSVFSPLQLFNLISGLNCARELKNAATVST